MYTREWLLVSQYIKEGLQSHEVMEELMIALGIGIFADIGLQFSML
jgi:hypothetical protein